MNNLPETGFLRIKQILGNPNANPPIPPIIPVGRSTWLEGVRTGRFPAGVLLGKRCRVWRASDILALIEETSKGMKNHGEQKKRPFRKPGRNRPPILS